MTAALGPSLAAVAAWLTLAAAGGWLAARALFPAGPAFRWERAGWGAIVGFAVLSASEAVCLAAGARPRPLLLLGASAAIVLAGRFLFPLRHTSARDTPAGIRWRPLEVFLGAAIAAGFLLYLLRSLTEPMWSNDFLAIWGLKGKAIAGTGSVPAWLRDPSIAGYSHPEYPLGLPLLFAALSSLLGRWDDHAAALVFPFIQAATLAVLAGWLRRRGASSGVALGAAALVALFEPLYSGFLAGMAEVPVSAAMLLVGTALADSLEGRDPGAVRRLAVASALAASIKNEGLFCAVIAAGIACVAAARSRESRPRALAAAGAALLPALAVRALSRIASGPAPLRDLDAGLLAPARWGELFSRIAEALRSAAEMAAPAWPLLLAIAALAALGRRRDASGSLLVIALFCLAAYLTIPAFGVRGPAWLARTTLPRTAAALAPLVAAGIAARLRFGEGDLSPSPSLPSRSARADGSNGRAGGP